MKTINFKEVAADNNLIAFCGLYCGACRSYLSGRCPGCRENNKAVWCKIRSCNLENKLQSCADCSTTELKKCKKFNSLISKVFGFMLNSDRAACIDRIRLIGYNGFAIEMAADRKQTLPRK